MSGENKLSGSYPIWKKPPSERVADALEQIAERLQGIEGCLAAFLMIEQARMQEMEAEEEGDLSPVEKAIHDALAKQKKRSGG